MLVVVGDRRVRGIRCLTVGIAWLIKPIFVSPIAEKTGWISTR